MPRIDPIQEAFTAGEISPRLWGRVSSDVYKLGLSKCENFIVYPHGGVAKRGGFRYVAEVKYSTKTTILQEFNYKDEFQYVFEFGHNYIRVFRNQATVMDGASPYEIVTTYTESEVQDLRFTQDEEKLFIVHKNHPPAELIRTDHDDWTLQDINFLSSGIATIDSIVEPTIHVWTIRTSAADNEWQSVCWSPELSLFCAVAESGTGNRVMTSPDGIKWTSRTSAADNEWRSVCWSSELSLFCAVAASGTGNRVMTSPDGINWTIRTSAANNYWYSVCWSSELSLFCAVAATGTGNRVMTSPDGLTWTIRTSAADTWWWSVCWSSELSLFCAVSRTGTGNRVMTSPDGITWTIRTSAADNSWYSVCWSSELTLFCAVAASGTGNRIMTSPDGITWTIRTSAADNDWYSVCWSPELSLFCAVAYSGIGNRVMTSPDGINWMIRTSAVDNAWYCVCWSPELTLFCAVGYPGTNNRVMTGYAGLKTGTYDEVELISDAESEGSGAEVTVVVVDNIIDTVSITKRGGLYEIGDTLSVEPTDIGGTAENREDNQVTCEVATLTVNDTPDEWVSENYPTLIWFFEQRLWLAATPNESNQIWGSRSADYFNLYLGEGLDNEGIALTIKSATKLLWAVDGNTAIIIGAHNGEFKLASNSLNEALTPSNIRPVQITNQGNAFIPVVQLNSDILFVQKGLRRIRRLLYDYASNSYKAIPVDLISEHITESGIVDVAHASEPNSIFWAIRTDGVLIAMTYEPDAKVFGWHKHVIGGTNTKIQSIVNIDGASDVAKDELWAVIERTIDGSTVKYVEFLVPEGLSLEDGMEDAFFVESGITKTGSGFTTFDGLDHLEGEEVRILADGAVQTPKTVSGGEVILDIAVDKAHAGLAYDASIETLPLEGGNPIGTAQAKIKRVSSLVLRLYRSLTFYMGDVFGNEDVYTFGPPEEMGSAIPLFTGDTIEQAFPGGYDTQGRIRIASYDPAPLTVLAIMYELRVKD